MMQNIQVYEAIISMLFVHPCYFQKLWQSKTIDQDLLQGWIFKIYKSHTEDARISNLLLSLALMIMEDEINQSDPTNAIEVHVKCFFTKLYRFLMNGQKCNTNFFREIAEHIILKIMIEEYDNDPLLKESMQMNMEQLDINKPENYYNLGCCLNNKNSKKSSVETEIMIERHMRVIKKMEIYLKNIFSQPSFGGSGMISKEICYFNKKLIDECKYVAEQKEKLFTESTPTKSKDRIEKVVKNAELLVIQLFFSEIGEYLLDSKSYGIFAPESYKELLSKANLTSITNTITSYFQQKKIIAKEEFDTLNIYLEVNSRKSSTIKPLINGLTAYGDYDITLENIILLTEEATELNSRYNAKLTVGDVMTIQNSLIQFLQYPNYFPAGNNDPLVVLLSSLGLEQIDISRFPDQILHHSLNLKINSEYFIFSFR